MKINIFILAEKLRDHVIDMTRSGSLDLNISSIDFYSEDLTELREDTIYLTAEENIPSISAKCSRTSIAVYGSYSGGLAVLDLPYLVFKEDCTLMQAYRMMEDVLSDFRSWEEKIYRAALTETSVSSMLALLAEPLANPVALFDASFVLAASAGSFRAKTQDEVWTDVLGKGYFHSETFTGEAAALLKNSTQPFVQQLPNLQKMQTCIRNSGEIIGYLGSTNINSDFTIGQISIMYLIQITIEQLNLFSSLAPYSSGKVSFLLERLLRGYHVEESAVQYFLSSRHWNQEDRFQMQYYCFTQNQLMEDSLWKPISMELSRCLPDGLICPFEEGILVLAHEQSFRAADIEEHFGTILKKNQMLCALSDTFEDFSFIRSAYLQCRAVLSVRQEKDNYGVWTFEDVFFDYVIQSLQNSVSLVSLCDPSVLKISERKNGMELIRSLHAFLTHGCSISRAAEALFLHRNTLIYRIELLEKELGVDFRQMADVHIFRLYLTCLILEAGLPAKAK